MNAGRPMLTLDEALARLVARRAPRRAIAETETVSTFDALGRVLAADVRSTLDVPPADNSVDGRLRAARGRRAGAPARVLPVTQRIPAGARRHAAAAAAPRRASSPARRCRPGADAVVMQEQCEARSTARVRVNARAAARPVDPPPRRRRAARRRRCCARGTRLTPQALGLAASVGAATLRGAAAAARGAVLHRRRAGDAGRAADSPGAIYNSNRFTLRGAAAGRGLRGAPTSASCPTGSTPPATRCAAPRAAHDLILTSRRRLGRRGRPPQARRRRPKAGSSSGRSRSSPASRWPSARVRRSDGSEALFVGLPGNPVSSFVTFLLAVRPVLRALQGADRRAAARAAAARRLRLAAARPAARVPARAPATPTAGSSCSPTRARAC